MIPVSEPLLDQRDKASVADCADSGWISSSGEYLQRFEHDWATRCDRRFGIAVSNGTVALQLAVAALDPAPGDEIIMPTFTIISCALAAIYNGCTPVLVDADPATWGPNVSAIEGRITERTRAIMPVHIYGHPVDMDPVLDLADRYGLALIEDAAEAHGARYWSARRNSWCPCGSFGDLSTFSFYANKLITTGEGGMVLTNDEGLANRAKSLRNLAFHTGQRFHHESLGFNFRMTNLQAALGVNQVARFDEIVARKRAMGQRYTTLLQNIEGLQLPAERPWAESVYWMYGVVLEDDVGLDAATLAARLRARGIDTRPFFLGMHEQPALLAQGLFRGEEHPVAERLSRRGLYIPSGLSLTEEQIHEVARAVREALHE